jgi:osmotically-inducible protein OsmY
VGLDGDRTEPKILRILYATTAWPARGGAGSPYSVGQYHKRHGRLYRREIAEWTHDQQYIRRHIRSGKGTRQMGTTKDIREAVEAELKFDPLVDDADIHVVNVNGDVALNGTVPSYPQYLEAAAATQRVGGVKNVHNHLEVVLSDADYRDDAMLTTAANNALTLNVTVPDGIEATARDGNVTLTGTVAYNSERAAAELAVGGLIGLRNVRNDIDIVYNADPVDVDLHVREALDRYALIPDDSDVQVDVEGGIITLTGHVRTWAEHDAAVGAAWMANGVIEVRDDLTITG